MRKNTIDFIGEIKGLKKDFLKKFSDCTLKGRKLFRKTELKMSTKFAGKPNLIFAIKIKALEAIFSENVFLLKEGEIGMLRNKAIGDG